MTSVSKLDICLSFKRILISCSDQCLFYSVLKVHPHRVTRLTTGAGV